MVEHVASQIQRPLLCDEFLAVQHSSYEHTEEASNWMGKTVFGHEDEMDVMLVMQDLFQKEMMPWQVKWEYPNWFYDTASHSATH